MIFIFAWKYFIPLQILVILTYSFKRGDLENHPLNSLFPAKIHFLVFNLSIFILCYLYNLERQLFCHPVPWAKTLIVLFILSFLSYPFFKKYKIASSILALFGGFGLFISIYLILFARGEYLIALAFNLPFIFIFSLDF